MASRSRIQLEAWLKTIEVNGKVLGIGEAQQSTKGRTKTWDVEEYKILDLEQPHECVNKPHIEMDINGTIKRTLFEGLRTYSEYFDIIFNHNLVHISYINY